MHSMDRSERVNAFVDEIWSWYARNKRSLPWRDLKIKDDAERAYRILVSEVMLQQTQVPRVIVIFRRFLEAFPRLQDLARASNRDVLIAWRGMGYNSRALRLRDAARTILEDFGGVFPKDMESLCSIKGIGDYTAAAIRNFAFGIPTPCLDTNIRRVLHRTFVGMENADGTWEKDDKYLLRLAEEVLEAALCSPRAFAGGERREASPFVHLRRTQSRRAVVTAAWHSALMDFGSLVQAKRNPKWDICPLTKSGICKAWNGKKSVMLSGAPKGRRRSTQHTKREPGRFVGAAFIPNRIFRGKIVEELRDSKRGLPLSELGKRVCLDWNFPQHQQWLRGVLKKLKADALVEEKRGLYVLKL